MNLRRGLLLCITILTMWSVTLWGQSNRSKVVLDIDGRNFYVHVVESGESVENIATAYSLDSGEVMQENRLTQKDTISKGRVLRIPCYERISRITPKRNDSRYERYAPNRGESLFGIAKEYAISLDTLLADNPSIDLCNLSERNVVVIRKSAMQQTQLPKTESESRKWAAIMESLSRQYSYVVVEAGKTLYSIAAELGVNVDNLLKINGSPTTIYAGMVVKYERTTPLVSTEYYINEESELTEETLIEADSTTHFALTPFEKDTLTVSMLLPLTNNGKVRGNFVEFYQGALLAAEELKAEGKNIKLQLYDVAHNPEQIASWLESDESFAATDLFVGPIYEEDVRVIAGINRPVILPLTGAVDSLTGRNLYRLMPTDSSRVNKLNGLVGPETNVIMVHTASIDSLMEREMLQVLGDHPFGKVIYNEEFVVDSLNSRPIEELMVEDDNLFMVLADNEIDTDRSLAIISSIMNSRQPKYGNRRVPVRVVGSADWAKYKNMDRNLLFKLDVSYLSNYHADRGNKQIKEFDRRFIIAFGRQPSMFAYRAYDAMKLFGSAMFEGGDLTAALNGSVAELLQIPYSFTEENGIMVNDAWALVNYRPNYTIEVK